MTMYYGKNPELNQYLANYYGYQGNFGDGDFSSWFNSQPNVYPELKSDWLNTLVTNYNSGTPIGAPQNKDWMANIPQYQSARNYGTSPLLNMQLANAFGFKGDFGSGNFRNFTNAKGYDQQAITDITNQYKAAYTPAADLGRLQLFSGSGAVNPFTGAPAANPGSPVGLL